MSDCVGGSNVGVRVIYLGENQVMGDPIQLQDGEFVLGFLGYNWHLESWVSSFRDLGSDLDVSSGNWVSAQGIRDILGANTVQFIQAAGGAMIANIEMWRFANMGFDCEFVPKMKYGQLQSVPDWEVWWYIGYDKQARSLS